MSSLSNLKLLHGPHKPDFGEVDQVIEEIIESKQPKKPSKGKSEEASTENQEEAEISMVEEGIGQRRRPQVVCMPYTSKNRLEVALTALEFVQRRHSNSVRVANKESQLSASTDSHNHKRYTEDEFDAELEQRSKLETLASWRKDLMTRLEMSATESKNEAERLNDFYDTDDVALDLELKEILENQYDARQQQ